MLLDYIVVPFSNAEEAWLWCCKIRLGGAAGRHAYTETVRPCETIDIYHIVQRLHQMSELSDSHLKVMVSYGERLAPPLSFKRVYDYECLLWEEAMNKLHKPFASKKIILPD